MLGKTTLMEAARFYERFGKTVKEAKIIPAIVEELNANLKADNKSSYHVRDMKRRLETFAMAFPRADHGGHQDQATPTGADLRQPRGLADAPPKDQWADLFAVEPP